MAEAAKQLSSLLIERPDSMCRLCCREVTEQRILSCGHCFCAECIDSIRSTEDVKACPSCGQSISRPANCYRMISKYDEPQKEDVKKEITCMAQRAPAHVLNAEPQEEDVTHPLYMRVTDSHVLINRQIEFKIIYGDLADAVAEVIVNLAGNRIRLTTSLTSSLLARAGKPFRAACAAIGEIAAGEVVETEGAGLQCKRVLHCNCKHWKQGSNREELERIITLCLGRVEVNGYHSVAFPAIGMGAKGFPTEVVIKSMIRAVTEHSRRSQGTCINHVMLYLFRRDLSSASLEIIKFNMKILGCKRLQNGFLLPHDVELQIVADNIADVQADIIVNSTGRDLILSEREPSKALFTKAGEPLQTECSGKAPIHTDQFTETRGHGLPCKHILHVNPPKWNSETGEQKLLEILAKCMRYARTRNAATIAFPAIGTGDLKYPARAVARCLLQVASDHARAGRPATLKKIQVIIFPTDTTTRSEFEGELGIQIAPPVYEDVQGDAMPGCLPYWEGLLEDYQECVVPHSTAEWQMCANKFRETMGDQAGTVAILEIKRIQNPTQLQMYNVKKKDVARRLGREEKDVEKVLWHGSTEQSVQFIAQGGRFDRSHADDNGTLGTGCYFSTSEYSSNDKYSKPTADGVQHMIMARVITGEYCRGRRSLRAVPDLCDSVVNSLSNPTTYVVFDDSSAYPSYIIKFRFSDEGYCIIL